MKTPQNKNWVWCSTEESRDKQTISILAIAETVFFIALTWFVAWYFDSYWHIFSAIFVAPWLLLKTDQSIKDGIHWFLAEMRFNYAGNPAKDKKFWLLLISGCALGFVVSYFLAVHWLIDKSGWQLFAWPVLMGYLAVGVGIVGVVGVGVGVVVGGGVVVGVVVGVVAGVVVVGVGVGVVVVGAVVVGAVGKKKLPYLLIFMPSVILGLILRSLVIKIAATIKNCALHPILSIQQIPHNFREQTLVNDIKYSPELLPGIGAEDDELQAIGAWHQFKQSDEPSEKIFYLILYISWLPAYLYRWSIKSTAWFYFPLAYLANLEHEAKQNNATETFNNKVNAVWNILLFVCLLSYFNIADISLNIPYFDVFWNSNHPIVTGSQDLILALHPYSMFLVAASIAVYFISLWEFSNQAVSSWFIRVHQMLWYVFFLWNLVWLFPVLWDLV